MTGRGEISRHKKVSSRFREPFMPLANFQGTSRVLAICKIHSIDAELGCFRASCLEPEYLLTSFPALLSACATSVFNE